MKTEDLKGWRDRLWRLEQTNHLSYEGQSLLVLLDIALTLRRLSDTLIPETKTETP